MAVGDVQLAIPVVLLLIVLVAALGSSPLLLVTLLGLTNWVGYGRVTRSLAVSLREREFVAAVTAAGGGGFTVTIPAGSSSITIPLTPVDDVAAEAERLLRDRLGPRG